ncbi:hypothetical protein SDJN02_11868, partial [Cucurbita argyrosperma subsp. argyrosperma]
MLIGGGKKFINGHGNKRDENSSYVHNIARGVYRVTMKMDKDIENATKATLKGEVKVKVKMRLIQRSMKNLKRHSWCHLESSYKLFKGNFLSIFELVVFSHVEEPDFKKLNVNDMVHLENQLEASLDKIKSQRVEAMMENSSWIDNMDMAIAMVDSQL